MFHIMNMNIIFLVKLVGFIILLAEKNKDEPYN